MSSDDDNFINDVDEYVDMEYSEDSYTERDAYLENQYYNTKLIKDDLVERLLGFERVIDLQHGEKTEWGFKALKQMIKIYFQLECYREMMACYTRLLSYMKGAVTQNSVKEAFISIVAYVSTAENKNLLLELYDKTTSALEFTRNPSLWFTLNINLGMFFLDCNAFDELQDILMKLRQSCQTDDAELDQKTMAQMLEIYALEIQMYMVQKNDTKLRSLYKNSMKILNESTIITRPIVIGAIRECGGKIYIHDGAFTMAITNFYESFKSYEEAGSLRRIISLKYLLLANMLIESSANPFEFLDIKKYTHDPEILFMSNLLVSYQENDVIKFESILDNNKSIIEADSLVYERIDDIKRNIRIKAIIKMVQPYRNISLSFIASRLNIDQVEVENLLASCILKKTINGSIDQINQVLYLHKDNNNESNGARYSVLNDWLDQILLFENLSINN